MLPSSCCRYPQNVDNLTAEDVKGISRLVEHPVPVYPPGEATETKELPIYLTADVSVCVCVRMRPSKLTLLVLYTMLTVVGLWLTCTSPSEPLPCTMLQCL